MTMPFMVIFLNIFSMVKLSLAPSVSPAGQVLQSPLSLLPAGSQPLLHLSDLMVQVTLDEPRT